jgi:hydrogenase 3 maturation protease
LVAHSGSTAPESTTGPIRVQKPSHLIIVDAAALGATPGEVALLEREDIDGITFCTHALPLSVVIDFIRSDHSALDVFALAVQAEHLLFGEPLSLRVEQAARAVAQLLVDCLPP